MLYLAACEQDPLPPGWEQVTDGEDVFYYHAASDTSTWNRPHATPSDLPAGWQRCHDDEGDVFYHNTVTGKSTWSKPTAPASAAAKAAGAAASSAAADGAGNGEGDDPDAGLPPAERERRRKARAARQVAVDAIASAERNRAARAAAGAGSGAGAKALTRAGGAMRRSSWRLLRAMVHTRAALNQHLSKAKRRRLRRGVFARAAGAAEPEVLTGDPPATPEALGAIAKAMGHFLFQSLPEAQRDAVVQGMRQRRYEAGSKIIEQVRW